MSIKMFVPMCIHSIKKYPSQKRKVLREEKDLYKNICRKYMLMIKNKWKKPKESQLAVEC